MHYELIKFYEYLKDYLNFIRTNILSFFAVLCSLRNLAAQPTIPQSYAGKR